MSEFKLTYFNSRGRGEVIRLVLTQAKKKFTDVRVTKEEWPAMKSSTIKEQLPVMEIDDKMLCERMAIVRYLGRELGLYGENSWEAAICDMVLDCAGGECFSAAVDKYEAKTDEATTSAIEQIDTALGRFEKLVVKVKKGKFILGEKASIADVALFDISEVIQSVHKDLNLASYPTLNEIANSFSSQPHIAAYIKGRPETEY